MANPMVSEAPKHIIPPALREVTRLPVTILAVPLPAIRPEATLAVFLRPNLPETVQEEPPNTCRAPRGLSRYLPAGITRLITRRKPSAKLWYERLLAYGLLPVVNAKKQLLGVIHEQDVLGNDPTAPAPVRLEATFQNEQAPLTLRKTDSLEMALQLFARCEQDVIPLIDNQGRYTGECASRRLLEEWKHGVLKPARIGGLATPLGVYMTSGYYTSGAGWKGLLATGALFAVVAYALDWLCLIIYSALATVFPVIGTLSVEHQMILQFSILLFCMLGLLRLSPMAGLHAAEHMSINAIENGLPLTEEVVRRQPREHTRCGTNVMVLLVGLELSTLCVLSMMAELNTMGIVLYGMALAGLVLRFWRTGGLWLQRHFTTKPPSAAQLASGIRAGEELLDKFRAHPHPNPNFWRRLWGSGLLHMASSFFLFAWILSHFFGKIGH